MKRVVQVVEALALLCAVVFVVMLFANEPEDVDTGGADAPTEEAEEQDPAEVDGAEIFTDRCASCHGADGDGGLGPKLSDGRAVEQFPDPADQIAVVTDGRRGMPSFEGRLSPRDIQAVVEYTRTL